MMKYDNKNNYSKNNYSNKPASEIIALDIIKNIKSYTNEKNILNEKIVRDYAQQIANSLVQNKDGKSTSSKGQIRKFYNEVKALENRLDFTKDDDELQKDYAKIFPLIMMLDSKVAYSKTRELVSDVFVAFMKKNIELLSEKKDVESFKHFLLFFEAVIGYYPSKIEA